MDELKLKQSNKESPTNSPIFPTTILQHHNHRYKHSTPNHSIDSSKSVLTAFPPCFPIKEIQVLLPSDYTSNQDHHPYITSPKTKPIFSDLTNQQGVRTNERMKKYHHLYPGIDNKKHSPELYYSSSSCDIYSTPLNLSL